MENRETLVYQAKLAEQTEYYDDMSEFMATVTKMEAELSNEERNLLSVAYKNKVGAKRASWRMVSSIEQRPDSGFAPEIVKEYRAKIEKELKDVCVKVQELLADYLIPKATAPECKVFYHKMSGDYYRYVAEVTAGDEKDEAVGKSKVAYEMASKEGEVLESTHPIRLGLALNFSVFYYEILNEPEEACKVAKKAFDDAIAKLENLKQDEYKDSSLILQLLRDNLTLWNMDNQSEETEQGTEN